MKKAEVILVIVLGVMAVIAMGAGISTYLASNQPIEIEPENYYVVLDIEGVNNLPPRLNQVVFRTSGLEAQFSSNPFPIEDLGLGEALTMMTGNIEVVCENYFEVQDFVLESDREGGALEKRIIFRNIPPASQCVASAIVENCESSIFNSCRLEDKFVRFSTPAN